MSQEDYDFEELFGSELFDLEDSADDIVDIETEAEREYYRELADRGVKYS